MNTTQPDQTMANIRRVVSLLQIIIQVLGIVGNFSILISYFQSSLRKLSVSIYMRGMAIFYMFELIRWLLYNRLHPNYDHSNVTCKLLIYLLYIFVPIGIWFEVVASFDRLLSIIYPMRFYFLRKTWFQILMVILIIVYNLAFYFRVFFDFSLQTIALSNLKVSVYCDTTNNSITFADFINITVLPFVLMMFSSIAIFVGVVQAQKQIRFKKLNQKSMIRNRRNIKFGITIISLNFLFLFMVLPLNLVNLFRIHGLIGYYVHIILNLVYQLYFAMNFVIQLLVNNIVRKEFVKCMKNLFKF